MPKKTRLGCSVLSSTACMVLQPQGFLASSTNSGISLMYSKSIHASNSVMWLSYAVTQNTSSPINIDTIPHRTRAIALGIVFMLLISISRS